MAYATELAELAANVAMRHPDDHEAVRVAEYAAQVVRDHPFGMDEPTATAYRDAIMAARELLRETIRDPEREGHPEYTRGVVNLIAELFGRCEMDTSTRMDEVARDIGVAP